MRLIIASLALATASSSFAAPSVMKRPPVGHPLIGKWQWTRDTNKCTEVYDYRGDGTAPVISGAERTDNVYSVAAQPDLNGFYRVTIRATQDHGGKDCADDASDSTGAESTIYIVFSPDREQYLACHEAKLNLCFGPLKRVKP